MYYRESGRTPTKPGQKVPEARKQALRKLVDKGPPPGLLAYRGRKPVGWVTLAPRAEFRKLARSPVMKPVDDRPVWSIVCFVVPAEHRHQGVATALLEGAIAYARKQGATLVEAYPVDKPGRSRDEWLWFGPLSMYGRAGFEEVVRRKPERPIVRLALREPEAPA
jgi:GNAT superfamily N-acetyltransferase